MERQITVSILDSRCLRCHAQNFLNDSGSFLCITLACNRLVKDSRGDVVAHDHSCGGNETVASNAVEDGIPLIGTAHHKDSSHLYFAWRTKGVMSIVV